MPKSRQQAWIRGLPGLNKKGGIPFETLPLSVPNPDERSLHVTFYGSSELVANLQSLAKQRTKLPKLSLVLRTDPVKEQDHEFFMTGAVIDSVTPAQDGSAAQTVNILFNSISMRLALTANPGPPADCPAIEPGGVNIGWMFEASQEDTKRGKPIQVVDFIAPNYNQRLTLILGQPSGEIANLIRNQAPIKEMILVLPDCSSQRYVEFQLWNTKATRLEDEGQISFKSNMIVCLTGSTI